MQVYLCGERNLDFTSKDGKQIKGTQLFVSYPWEGVTGEMTDKIFARPEIALPPEMAPGDILDITFDKRGRAEKIIVVKQGK